jgi:phage-related protein
MENSTTPKPLFWVGSAPEDLRNFPAEVRAAMGVALYVAQKGAKHQDAKPLKGFGGASVLEIVDDSDGKTYRAIYTVRFPGAVYVLHAFQKTSRRGSVTPQQERWRIESRLRQAEEHSTTWHRQQKP